MPSAPKIFEQAQAAHRAGRQSEAEHLYHEVIRLCPDHLEALHSLAGIALESGQAARGVELIARTIALKPDDAYAHANLGYGLSLLDRFEEAEAHYGRAVALEPDFAEAHYSRGVMRDALRCRKEAIACYDEAIRLKPHYCAAHINRANVLYDLQQFEEALASYDRAVALSPANADIHYNRGNTLYALERYEDAIASFNAAIALKPAYPNTYNNRGVALNELRSHAAALASFDEAIKRKHDYAEAHANRAVALADAKRYTEALASYDCAIALNPQLAKSHYGRGVALNELRRFQEALASYKRALELAPDSPFLLGKFVHMKMAVCDWQDLDQLKTELAQRITQGEPVTPPFQILAICDTPALHRRAAEIYAAAGHPITRAIPAISKYPLHDKIRLGYFSADLHDHATAILAAELFERHDKARFALTAFSFGPDRDDPMRRRLRAAFDRFVDVRDHTDKETALLARELEIDICVDLKGYTGDERHKIFAWRTAPIQVSYLGYPGTMGAPYVDYLIADNRIISPADRSYYTEKIVTLPHSYQPNDTMRPVTGPKLSRAQAGLPENAFVFCCFNNSYKITPDVFSRWMHILTQVEPSVLWLLEDNPRALTNLRLEAAKRGVAPERLIFAPRVGHVAHLARHVLADLFLDTLPYNAHTTASDALWMGLPILTQRGESFAARVAASLLKTVELPDLVTATAGEYEEAAIRLARHPERLQAIHQQLVRNRLTTPLFDTLRFTKAIEAAYSAMYERYHKGLAPEHIDVPSVFLERQAAIKRN